MNENKIKNETKNQTFFYPIAALGTTRFAVVFFQARATWSGSNAWAQIRKGPSQFCFLRNHAFIKQLCGPAEFTRMCADNLVPLNNLAEPELSAGRAVGTGEELDLKNIDFMQCCTLPRMKTQAQPFFIFWICRIMFQTA